jgi:hypothetical protein
LRYINGDQDLQPEWMSMKQLTCSITEFNFDLDLYYQRCLEKLKAIKNRILSPAREFGI